METLSGELMPPSILLFGSLSAGVTRTANGDLNSEIGMVRCSQFAYGHGICGVLWWDLFSFALLAPLGYSNVMAYTRILAGDSRVSHL